MNDNQTPIVCSPLHHVPVSGALQRTCSECDGKVWVSSSMVGRVDSGEMRPVCIDCATPLIGSGRQVAVHDDQVDELNNIGIMGFTRRFVEEINANPERWFDYRPRPQRVSDPFGWHSRQSPGGHGHHSHDRTQGREKE